jgi:glutamate synthase (NADPH) small chain
LRKVLAFKDFGDKKPLDFEKVTKMAELMLKFVTIDKEMPQKREADTRNKDFLEIYGEFILQKAQEQASRCSQCGVPFCQSGCPLQNNIPDWLKLTATGRLEEAYQLSSATNPLPEICGRICPQDRLCEGSCVIEQSTHGSVTIGSVERFLTETAFQNNWVAPLAADNSKDQSVAIIGAGPAGIAAAQTLRGFGYKVTIYDRHDRAGGLLIYGIPGFKLEKDVVIRRQTQLEEAGVEFQLGVDIGNDITLEQLKQKHDAVLIATGVYKARNLGLAGDEAAIRALDYLIASNKVSLGDNVDAFENGNLNAKGKNVVVIGGGDTAMDCVRTAIRQGAKSVSCLYRRDRANMPGSAREVKNAEEEGVTFNWLSAPKSLVLEGGKITGLQVAKMRLTEADGSGRKGIEEIKNSEELIAADMVICALGFEPEDLPVLFKEPTLKTTKWGTIKAHAVTAMTSIDGVFAAGDIVRGASLVVWALKDGKEAADEIHKYLKAKA